MDADLIAARNTESAELLLRLRLDRFPSQLLTINFDDQGEVSLFSTRPRRNQPPEPGAVQFLLTCAETSGRKGPTTARRTHTTPRR